MDYAKEGTNEHRRLELYGKIRFSSLNRLFRDEVQVLIEYEKLICRATIVLGAHPPKDTVDRCIRDLYPDVFDCLYISRQVVLKGYQGTAFPLLRRAFEGISLMEYFMLRPDKAAKWDKGQEISNVEVRKYLDSHPMGESGETMRDDYTFFSGVTHLNRDSIPTRFLGEGNRFVLGAVGSANPVVLWRYARELLQLWFWVAALLSWRYREIIRSTDKDYESVYMSVAGKAETVAKRLLAQLDDVLRLDSELEKKRYTK